MEALEQKGALEGRFKRMEELMVEKQDEMRAKAHEVQERLNKVYAATKILQKEVSLRPDYIISLSYAEIIKMRRIQHNCSLLYCSYIFIPFLNHFCTGLSVT